MSKDVTRFFSAWGYRKNEQDLDRRSAEGWRLIRPGLVRYRFEESDTVCRYRLDYCPDVLGVKEPERRQALYEAQGWRHVGNNGNGWTFWEKPFDPALGEEAYALPCQRTPEQEKLLGPISLYFWLRIVLVVIGLALAVVAVIRGRQMVIPALIYLVCILLLFFRMQALQEKLK